MIFSENCRILLLEFEFKFKLPYSAKLSPYGSTKKHYNNNNKGKTTTKTTQLQNNTTTKKYTYKALAN